MIIIFIVQLSLIANLYLLLQYLLKGDKKYSKWFILFLLANIFLISMVMGLYIFLPSLFDDADSTFVLWIFSGLFTGLTLSTKIQIIKTSFKRIKEQKRLGEIIKDNTSVQKTESDRLLAERQMLYRQMPYRHIRSRELKKLQNEEKRKAENQPAKNILELTTTKEMFIFLSIMPFFLLSSGYFLAKIINFFIYGEF